MTKIVYLPLDERPCNYDYPRYLAGMTELELTAPDRSLLGDKKRPADTDGIAKWLAEETKDADYALVSLDMLLYGGIVPSRLHLLDTATLEGRMETLRELKRIRPSLKLHAFHLITRAPAYSSSEEEPDYYADFGRELYEYGWLNDKRVRDGLTEAEGARLEDVSRIVPASVFEDFLGRRQTNQRMNELSVALAEEGVIDYLVIPLDDNSKYGYTSSEQRSLMKRIQERGLLDRIAVYPGADEIGCTMFSRIFCEVHRYEPLVHVRYSSTLGPTIIPKYEDRSLNESVKHHIAASGACLAGGFETPDIYLMVHAPAASGTDVAETTDGFDAKHHSYFAEINLREFAGSIARYAKHGKTMALADTALCNGGDDVLMKLLAKQGLLSALDCYAAWNTSGNAIGTAVSHAVIASYNRSLAEPNPDHAAASEWYLQYRLIEDWGYQALVRQQITEQDLPGLDASYFRIAHVQPVVERLAEEKLQRFAREYVPGGSRLRISGTTLPWKRMFEVGFRLERE